MDPMPAARSTKLLLDEYPLILLPTAACVFGDRAALFLQQVHYWCKLYERDHKLRHYHAGRWWVWNSLDGWLTNFPFWSTRTIERIIGRLQSQDLILIDNYNLMGYDRTRWYTPHYEVIVPTIETWKRKQQAANPPSCQTVIMQQDRLTGWAMPNSHDATCQPGTMQHADLSCTIPETTQRLPETNADMAIAWSACTQELGLILPRAIRSGCLDRAALTAYDPAGPAATITCQPSPTCSQFASSMHTRILATLAAILHQPDLSIVYKKPEP